MVETWILWLHRSINTAQTFAQNNDYRNCPVKLFKVGGNVLTFREKVFLSTVFLRTVQILQAGVRVYA